jgi:hypothetical protein
MMRCDSCGHRVNHYGPTGYEKPQFFTSAEEKQGDTALWLGKPLTDNPYEKGSRNASRWKTGYLNAQSHYRRIS